MSDMNEINNLKLLNKFPPCSNPPVLLLQLVCILSLCMIVIKYKQACVYFQKPLLLLFTHMILSTNIYLGAE